MSDVMVLKSNLIQVYDLHNNLLFLFIGWVTKVPTLGL